MANSGSSGGEWRPELPTNFTTNDYYCSYKGKVVYDLVNNRFITEAGLFTPQQCVYAVCGYSQETGMSLISIQLDHIIPDTWNPYVKHRGIKYYNDIYTEGKSTLPQIDSRVRLLRNFRVVPKQNSLPQTSSLLELASEHSQIIRGLPFKRGQYRLFTLDLTGQEYCYPLKRGSYETMLTKGFDRDDCGSGSGSGVVSDSGGVISKSSSSIDLIWRGAGGGMAGGNYSIGSYKFGGEEDDDREASVIFVLYFENRLVDAFEANKSQLFTICESDYIAPCGELVSHLHVANFRLAVQIIQRNPRISSSFNEICSLCIQTFS
tara:strand:+ start:656 stop:1615 length:960 start_codon:yes stop_codon:yes gene_type:complete